MELLEYWRKNDASDRRGITEIKPIMGLYRLWDSLLKEIDADKVYVFTDADDTKSFDISGRELIENGFTVKIQEKRKAKIYFYKEK